MLEKYELPIGLKNNTYEKQGGKHILNEFNALFDIQLYKHVFLKNLTIQDINDKNKSKSIKNKKSKKKKIKHLNLLFYRPFIFIKWCNNIIICFIIIYHLQCIQRI